MSRSRANRRLVSLDSEAMGFLLQLTMSCPCVLSRQVAVAGCWRWCCELAVDMHWWRQVAGAGVVGAGAGAVRAVGAGAGSRARGARAGGAVSWLRTWAGAGRRVPALVL